MTAQLISTPYHLPNGGGPALWHLAALLTVKATASQTGGRLWARSYLPSGAWPPTDTAPPDPDSLISALAGGWRCWGRHHSPVTPDDHTAVLM